MASLTEANPMTTDELDAIRARVAEERGRARWSYLAMQGKDIVMAAAAAADEAELDRAVLLFEFDEAIRQRDAQGRQYQEAALRVATAECRMDAAHRMAGEYRMERDEATAFALRTRGEIMRQDAELTKVEAERDALEALCGRLAAAWSITGGKR